ncbi:hypothetical protein MBFIL_10490 [Methanobrevibacter filiformis]|uniref:Uncharacterized protein n=1 Tax=Methanobrevibacter filiformis TaxID=55758 RepID=A0A166CE14_9EURY|nr:hypothetical protein MBFIL_10490 [Methanobrevibacter filiformis]
MHKIDNYIIHLNKNYKLNKYIVKFIEYDLKQLNNTKLEHVILINNTKIIDIDYK